MVFQVWETPARSTTTSWFFHRFFTKKYPKKLEKLRWRSVPGKHCFESALLGAFFSQTNDFWSIFGSLWEPNWAPKSIPILQNRILVPPGGPRALQGASLGRFWVHFGAILGPLGSTLAPLWGYTGSKKQQTEANPRKRWQTAANNSKQQETAENSSS